MAAIVKRGLVKPDADGRVDQVGILKGLMGIGNSKEMSAFQALGIAGFKAGDPHQQNRIRERFPDPAKGLNFYNWNPADSCSIKGNQPNLESGVPCNAVIEYQQHAFSTVIRDPKDGKDIEKRFEGYFTQRWSNLCITSCVLTKISGVDEPVMTIGGLGRLLKKIRLDGDKNGENSLTKSNKFKNSLQQFFHPSATKEDDYTSLAQWQAVGAWSAFFAAFSRVTGRGEAYMPESDLRRFFLDSDFPADWRARPWGLRETFKVAASLDGSGAGDHWSQNMKASLAKVGGEASETQYQMEIMGYITAGNLDQVSRSFP